jgi:hypothetical protein
MAGAAVIDQLRAGSLSPGPCDIAHAGTGRCRPECRALDDPGFALEVFTAGPGVDPGLVGRVLDFHRSREGCTTPDTSSGPTAACRPAVTVADAIASYDAGPWR